MFRGNVIRICLFAAIGLSALTGCVPSSSHSSGSGGSSTSGNTPAPYGSPVSDGKLQFKVTSADRSSIAGDPTNEFMQEKAKGEFINVHLVVTNTGNEARSFSAGNQKLIINGNKYDAASVMGVPGDGDNINPGLSVDTVASFDVPPGSVPEAIELHDSMFSGGAQASLAGASIARS